MLPFLVRRGPVERAGIERLAVERVVAEALAIDLQRQAGQARGVAGHQDDRRRLPHRQRGPIARGDDTRHGRTGLGLALHLGQLLAQSVGLAGEFLHLGQRFIQRLLAGDQFIFDGQVVAFGRGQRGHSGLARGYFASQFQFGRGYLGAQRIVRGGDVSRLIAQAQPALQQEHKAGGGHQQEHQQEQDRDDGGTFHAPPILPISGQ